MSEPIEGEIVNSKPQLRLTKHDENIVLLLEDAFRNGYNITEACLQAGISRQTYYEWLADDEVFSNRIDIAQTSLNRKAKSNVTSAINGGDPSISLKYLTLRDPDFKPKAEVALPPELQETRNNLKEVLDAIAKHDPSSEPATTDEPEDAGMVAGSPTDIS